MLRSKLIFLSAAVIASHMFVSTDTADAGPLLDWLRGRFNNTRNLQQPAYNYYASQPNTAQYVGNHNPQGLQPGQCMRTCNKTCTRTVVNYVPYTAYRTSWNRVPVTSYRPVTNSDPCTGCTVTCMRPCTTYTYQMQRVPYTTYRPVYRQEAYQVPVTTITNDCANGNCNPCNTCGTGVNGAVPNYVTPPASATPTNAGSQYVTPTYPGSTPADSAPSLPSTGSTSRLEAPGGMISTNTTYSSPQLKTPSVSIPRDLEKRIPRQSAMIPVRRKLNYSSVRLASHSQKLDSVPVRATSRSNASVQRRSLREINSIWQDVK